MAGGWQPLSYSDWSQTCDTLHAHTQVLGKLAAKLAPAEPQFQHLALRLTARGWETPGLAAPDGSGAIVAALDLRTHEAVIEHSQGTDQRVALTPDRPVGEVTAELLDRVKRIAGPVEIDPTPQEVPWSVPLDRDSEHTRYDREQVARYFQAATRAALVLTAFRAPYRGRCTPVSAWWGSFDLAVSLFSGAAAAPPANREVDKDGAQAPEFAVGWWPGDARYDKAAFYAYASPATDGFAQAELSPADARWESDLGEHVLDWQAVCAAADPTATALQFARSAFRAACASGQWDPALDAAAPDTNPQA